MRVRVRYTFNFLTPLIQQFFASGQHVITSEALYMNGAVLIAGEGMNRLIPMKPTQNNRCGYFGQRGIAALELALILPLMITMAFVIIDFGMLIQARLVVANLAREGGSLASRDIVPAGNLITMLQAGASPLNLSSNGRIYIWRIRAGATNTEPGPLHRSDVERERRRPFRGQFHRQWQA